VNVRDSAEAVAGFLQEYGATFIGAPNRSPSDVAKMYKIEGTPSNVIIDREGNYVTKIVGYDMDKLMRALRRVGIE
jgi:thioredoxin-related protein